MRQLESLIRRHSRKVTVYVAVLVISSIALVLPIMGWLMGAGVALIAWSILTRRAPEYRWAPLLFIGFGVGAFAYPAGKGVVTSYESRPLWKPTWSALSAERDAAPNLRCYPRVYTTAPKRPDCVRGPLVEEMAEGIQRAISHRGHNLGVILYTSLFGVPDDQYTGPYPTKWRARRMLESEGRTVEVADFIGLHPKVGGNSAQIPASLALTIGLSWTEPRKATPHEPEPVARKIEERFSRAQLSMWRCGRHCIAATSTGTDPRPKHIDETHEGDIYLVDTEHDVVFAQYEASPDESASE